MIITGGNGVVGIYLGNEEVATADMPAVPPANRVLPAIVDAAGNSSPSADVRFIEGVLKRGWYEVELAGCGGGGGGGCDSYMYRPSDKRDGENGSAGGAGGKLSMKFALPYNVRYLIAIGTPGEGGDKGGVDSYKNVKGGDGGRGLAMHKEIESAGDGRNDGVLNALGVSTFRPGRVNGAASGNIGAGGTGATGGYAVGPGGGAGGGVGYDYASSQSLGGGGAGSGSTSADGYSQGQGGCAGGKSWVGGGGGCLTGTHDVSGQSNFYGAIWGAGGGGGGNCTLALTLDEGDLHTTMPHGTGYTIPVFNYDLELLMAFVAGGGGGGSGGTYYGAPTNKTKGKDGYHNMPRLLCTALTNGPERGGGGAGGSGGVGSANGTAADGTNGGAGWAKLWKLGD